MTTTHPPEYHRRQQWKEPCRVATTASITIATALNAGDTIDGVVLVAGDRVLVKDQGTGSQNGVYIAGASPARAYDFDTDEEVPGAIVYVRAGTANAATAWSVTNTGAVTLGTTAITIAAFGGGGALDPDEVRDAGRWEVVMAPGVTSPPDPVQTPAGDDWTYAWVTP